MCTVTENASDCVRDCQTEPVRGCTGPERYLLADPKTKTIVQHMETLAVSWFATHGTFEFSRTDNEQSPSSSSNTWTAPSVASPVRLWFVLRDSRRGVAWRELDVVVED